jgi:hypothetical protein
MGKKICGAVFLPSVFAIGPLASGEDAPIPWEQSLRESAVLDAALRLGTTAGY